MNIDTLLEVLFLSQSGAKQERGESNLASILRKGDKVQAVLIVLALKRKRVSHLLKRR